MEENHTKKFQEISASIKDINGCDLLFNYVNESHKTGSTAEWSVKDAGLNFGIILSFLYAYSDLPSKYHSILPVFKTEIETYPNYQQTQAIFLSLSLLARTPANRTVLYNSGFHSVTFNVLVKEDLGDDSRLSASQALCNMTYEESAEKKNTILNAEGFGKLKTLMDKIISSSPSSLVNKNVAKKNAILIENIFLILSNMLVGNNTALTPIIDSGFKSYILNHLSPDDDDEKRKKAGNIQNQQKAALRVLHSITFHQSKHISSLMSSNVLGCVKVTMDGNDSEIIELAMCGVLYNISVKGNVGVLEYKTSTPEVNKNHYLAEYKQVEGLIPAISNAAKTGPGVGSTSLSSYTTRTKQYAALILGQLYRNTKLEVGYHHIFQSLKTMKNGTDTDLSFKAQNAIEMLRENDDNSQAGGF